MSGGPSHSQSMGCISPNEYNNPNPPRTVTPDQDLVIDVYISEDRKEKLVLRKGQNLE